MKAWLAIVGGVLSIGGLYIAHEGRIAHLEAVTTHVLLPIAEKLDTLQAQIQSKSAITTATQAVILERLDHMEEMRASGDRELGQVHADDFPQGG